MRAGSKRWARARRLRRLSSSRRASWPAFARSSPALGAWNPGPYYWHGNQPDIHAAYLFNDAARPDLTQKWVRWILENKYGEGYDGLDGNDDAGTLSAWYVLSALGFYPVAGTDRYQLGAPLFETAEVKLAGGTLKILAEQFEAPGWLVGGLIPYTLVNTLVPALTLRTTPSFESVHLDDRVDAAPAPTPAPEEEAPQAARAG